MSGKRRRQEGVQSRHGRQGADPTDDMHITTPEGDEIAIASVRYRVSDPLAVAVLLSRKDDFELEGGADRLEAWDPDGDESLMFIWLETDPRAPVVVPMGQRILASVTLTGTTLEAEAMSQRRLDACRMRLEEFLSGGLRLLETRTKTLEQAMMEAESPDFEEPFLPPPEFLAEIEEQMLRQWIDESIPALGGLTPREAVKTPEGRENVLELIEEMTGMDEFMSQFPGMFAPDYRKVKEMLDLE